MTEISAAVEIRLEGLLKDIERLQAEGSKRYGRIGSEIESLRAEIHTLREERKPWFAPAFLLTVAMTLAGVAYWAGQAVDNGRRIDAVESSLVPRNEFEIHLRVARERQDEILKLLTNLDNRVMRLHNER